ncbi:MAG: sigma-70 family RNA polymerase sigma factor, partial [Lachnospiraceae bacterium]
MKNYNQLTDEQLIVELRAGDGAIMDFIMDKYKNLVRKKAKAMYLLGGDSDDLIQEGMIGLFKAVRDYDINQTALFYSFAELCISRQLFSAIETAQRKKHMPLNSYVSIYDAEDGPQEDKKLPLIDTIQSAAVNDPEELFINKEYVKLIESELKEVLSTLENRVLYLHLRGT